jgi:hypothetical protein
LGYFQSPKYCSRAAPPLLLDPAAAIAAGETAARGAARLSGAVEKTIAAVKSLGIIDAHA